MAGAAGAAGKQVARRMKLIVGAGQAKPAPPVGPAIGQAGLNLMMFCKDFNARTAQFAPDTPLKCYVTAYTDKTYDMKILLPQTSWFIKRAAGLDLGAATPGRETVGVVTLKHVYEIARAKMPEFPKRFTLATVCRTVIAQCRSMGVAVVADEEAAVARYPQCKG